TCGAIYIGDRETEFCTAASLGIGANLDQIPSACRNTNYFSYGISGTGNGSGAAIFTATRCVTPNGKAPGATAALTLILTTAYNTGSDVWSGTGSY
ncbi:MAG: hypothetical protein ABIH27_07160, partial [Candidatus Omnitrophota bacterium]